MELIPKLYRIEKIKKEFEKGKFERIDELEKIASEISMLNNSFGEDLLNSLKAYKQTRDNAIQLGPGQLKSAYETLMHHMQRAVEYKERYEEDIAGSLDNMRSWRIKEDLSRNFEILRKNHITKEEATKIGLSEEYWKEIENRSGNAIDKQTAMNIVRDGYAYILARKVKTKEIGKFLDRKESLEEAVDNENIGKIEKILEESGIRGKFGYKNKRIIGLLDKVNKQIYKDENGEDGGNSLGWKENAMIILGTLGSPILYTVLTHNLMYPPGTPWYTTFLNEKGEEKIKWVTEAVWVGVGTLLAKLGSVFATDMYFDTRTNSPSFYFGASWELLPFYLAGRKIKEKIGEFRQSRGLKQAYKAIDRSLSSNPVNQKTTPEISKNNFLSMFLNQDTNLPGLLSELKENDKRKFLEIREQLQKAFENSCKSIEKVDDTLNLISYAEFCGLDTSKVKKILSKKIDEDSMKLAEMKSNLGE